MMGLLGQERSLTISSALWIHGYKNGDASTDKNKNKNVTDRPTDRRTPGDSKDHAYT